MTSFKKKIFLFIYISFQFITSNIYSQERVFDYLNLNIKYKFDLTNDSVLNCLNEYFKLKLEGKTYKHLWNPIDSEKLNYDYIITELQTSNYYNNTNYYKPTVLSISNFNEYKLVKVAFISNSFEFSGAYCFYLSNINKNYLINSSFRVNTISWYRCKTNHIQYIMSPKLVYNESETIEMESFKSYCEKLYEIKIENINFFATINLNELESANGVEYNPNLILSDLNGSYCDPHNNTIYSSNNKLIHKHELIHIFNAHKTNFSMNRFWDEGIATYFGGSLGHPLNWHLNELKKYLINNNINFSNLENLGKLNTINSTTNVDYAVSGLLVKLILENKSQDSFNNLLKMSKTTEDIYNLIFNTLGVKKVNLDEFIKKKINQIIFYD